MNIGQDGIYRLYRNYPQGVDHVDQRLIAVLAVMNGQIHHLEDHDHILDELLPEGKLDDTKFYRMMQLQESPYWRLVHENDIERGEHPDLLPEADAGGNTWQTPVVRNEEPERH